MPAAAWLLAFAASGLLAVGLILAQQGLRYLTPSQGAVVSVPSATLLLWLMAAPGIDWTEASWRAAAIFAGVGLFFPASVTLLTFESNRRMGPSVAGALGNLSPLFAVGFAVIVLGEAPRPMQAVGIAAIVAGVAALSLNRRWLGTSWPLWAVMLPLGGAAIRGIIQAVTKIGMAIWPSALAAGLIGYTVSTLVILAVAAAGRRLPRRGTSLSGMGWFAAAGIANVSAVLAMYAALGRGPSCWCRRWWRPIR